MAHPDPGTLVVPTLVVIGGFTWYVIAGSVWFSRCDAQLDPSSLGPVNCVQKPEEPQGQGSTLWPAFGSYNRSHEGLADFWGDDLITQAFTALGETAGGTLRPLLRDHFVPSWNWFFEEKARRDAVMWVIGPVTTALAGELVKEWWRHYGQQGDEPGPRGEV